MTPQPHSSNTSPQVALYTDGSYFPQHRQGGWGVAVFVDGHLHATCNGVQAHTTSLEMELKAAVEGLLWLENSGFTDTITHLYTDSKILIEGLEFKIQTYHQQAWQHLSGRPVESRVLWEQLEELTQTLGIEVHWIKGHRGHLGNELADELASSAVTGEAIHGAKMA